MALVQLAGYAAFIVASLVLGTRLMLLWRRTREWPELTLGGAYLVAGALGYVAWLVIGVLAGRGATPQEIKNVAVVGLALTTLGAVFHGIGTALIFRRRERWAQACVGVLAFALFSSWGFYASAPAGGGSPAGFWRTILLLAPVYLWSAAEAITLGRLFRKRARLGLTDPLVANRTVLFGVSSAAVFSSIAISYSAQLVYGATPPTWTATLASSVLLMGATAIWLGFFPPVAYAARIVNGLGSE